MSEHERLMHVIDQLETRRTMHVRNEATATDLLTDALHALRNGAPEVTEEFIERAMRYIAPVPFDLD